MAKNPKIELPLRNDFGILCDPKIVPNTNLDTVCFTLPFFMHKVPNVLQPHPPLTFLLSAKNLCHFLIGFCIGGIV